MITPRHGTSWLSILLIGAFGCSKGSSLKTVGVSGKVTLNGEPLAGANIMFVAEMPPGAVTSPAPSTGITGADGSYKLVTMASGKDIVDGAPPGNYKVTVTKQAAVGGAPGAAMNPNDTAEFMKRMQSMSPEEAAQEAAKRGGAASQPGQGAASPKSEVPARYFKAGESGLTATVAASGAQTFDFPLTSP